MTKGNISHPNIQRKGNAALLSSAAYFPGTSTTRRKASTQRNDRTACRNLALVTPAQSRRNRNPKEFKVSIHADMMKVTSSELEKGMVARDAEHCGGKRGNVGAFSRASRKRMIEFMAKVRNVGSMLFVTLTYDDTAWLVKSSDHHRDFEALRKRFERSFPNWRAIWRVEIKRRLSGLLAGHDVPHFHMIIFTGVQYDEPALRMVARGFQEWGKEVWQTISGSIDEYHLMYGFHVSPMFSRKQAYRYVSKYVAKKDEDNIECGRRWGRIGQFDTSASETFRLSQDEYIELRRLIKRWLKTRNKKYSRRFAKCSPMVGCTVFGMGDTQNNGERYALFEPFALFVSEAKRQALERAERERGYGS